MVATLIACRSMKQSLEDKNDSSSERYHKACRFLKDAEEKVGADWDGVTVLEDNGKPAVAMPDYIGKAMHKGDARSVLKWINANRSEDRVNANSGASMPLLCIASMSGHLDLMTLLLQLGANVNFRASTGPTVICLMCCKDAFANVKGGVTDRVRLLLSWGANFANFFPGHEFSRVNLISDAREYGEHQLANLLESELGGRRCTIVNLSSQPELNGRTCVVDEYLPSSNQYKVTLENKIKQEFILSPDNLERRDRTPQDCGYYIEFKNGRTIRHDFDSSEDCQAFVASLNGDQAQLVVTEEAKARADQAAAELLAELGLDDSPNGSSSGCKAEKSNKKKGGKKKKKK